MKFYLSSYKLGDETERLKRLIPKNQIGYIPNALDYKDADRVKIQSHVEADIASLRQLAVKVELLNLRTFFGRKDKLRQELEQLGAIFISGGNTFVLRQAMRLSGLDALLEELLGTDFLYAGYSAAGAVLAPSLKGVEIVDAPETPYAELKEVLWNGLGFVDFAFAPHWKSNHPESAAIDKLIDYYNRNNIHYRAIRDGEVIVIE